jgi:putative membrane protein
MAKEMDLTLLDSELNSEASSHPELIRAEHQPRRTALAFQRTRMSADRTLMAVIRTALSLIGFGFTIYQFFRYLRESEGAIHLLRINAPRNFGIALVVLGVVMLSLGIWRHVAFMLELRAERKAFWDQGLIPGDDKFPVSITLITAALLLALGLVAIAGMAMRAGPFH